MIDSHCHLDYYAETYHEVIKRAEEAGVKGMLTVNTHLDKALFLQKMAEEYGHVWCSVGIHPHEAHSLCREKLETLLKHPKVVALGETGLDYFYENSEKKKQIESFEAHLDVAAQHNLPVIIHTREADADTLMCLDRYPKAKGVLHCFTGSYEFAKQGCDRGLFISFSGIITFKNAGILLDVVRKIPLDMILIETDSPYLTPIPHRGQKNEPAFVRLVAEKIAEIKESSYEEIVEITTRNFFKVFPRAL